MSIAVPTLTSIWHLTDVHVDPYYVVGSDAANCYCETYESCARIGKTCGDAHEAALAAPPWGSSEGNCATPVPLYESCMDFMSSSNDDNNSTYTQLAYYTGDFTEAGAPDACNASSHVTAHDQVIGIIRRGWKKVKDALGDGARVFGVLGNHDLVPGDYCYGTSEMQWLYANLTEIWADDLAHDTKALATLVKGGYYATDVHGSGSSDLRVVALNTNYFSSLNPEMKNSSSAAYQLGLDQMVWFEQELKDAVQRQQSVHILGHIMSDTADEWVDNFYIRFQRAVALADGAVKGLFWGHVHTDQWTLLRTCDDDDDGDGDGDDDGPCLGTPTAVMLAGPSLTEGYPATYPAVRRLDFDTETWDLYDATTFHTDLHDANSKNMSSLQWEKLYSFREHFGMPDLSTGSFSALIERMSETNSLEWELYRGGNNGTTPNVYCSGYTNKGAPFAAKNPCTVDCLGACKTNWIAWLNGSVAANAN